MFSFFTTFCCFPGFDKMASNILCEEYENQWTLNLNDLNDPFHQTPVFSPSKWIDMNMWFSLTYHKTSNIDNFSLRKNETTIRDSLSVLVNKSFDRLDGKCKDITAKLFCKIVYNKLDHPNIEFANFDRILPGNQNHNINVGCVKSIVSENNVKTRHARLLESSNNSVILKCRFYLSGHLGSVYSYFQLKSIQSNLFAFLKDYTSIYELKYCSDFEVHIEDKILSTHKFVLAAHSKVFKMMIEHDCLESKTNTLTISDFTYEAFDCFLRYLYSGRLPGGCKGRIGELYALADKYDVGTLKNICASIIVSDISLENITKLLPCVYNSTDDELKEKVKSFAVKNFANLMMKSEWKELVKSHLEVTYEIAAESFSESESRNMKQSD